MPLPVMRMGVSAVCSLRVARLAIDPDATVVKRAPFQDQTLTNPWTVAP